MELNNEKQTTEKLLQQSGFTQPSIYNRPTYDATLVYKFMLKECERLLQERGRVLSLAAGFNFMIGQLSLWFAYDARFGGDLQKSILLRGTVGTGKTILARALANTISFGQKQIPLIIPAIELQKLYVNKQEQEITTLKTRFITIVDDLGVEMAETKNFGNISEPFNDLYDARYRAGLHTIVTTNLVPSEIGEKYGVRILDRFRETMNDLVFDYESFRK